MVTARRVPWCEVLGGAEAVVGHVVQYFHSKAMVVVLEQDLELDVLVAVYVRCLDIFDERDQSDRLALLCVMGRDILSVSARKELGLESGICDF